MISSFTLFQISLHLISDIFPLLSYSNDVNSNSECYIVFVDAFVDYAKRHIHSNVFILINVLLYLVTVVIGRRSCENQCCRVIRCYVHPKIGIMIRNELYVLWIFLEEVRIQPPFTLRIKPTVLFDL